MTEQDKHQMDWFWLAMQYYVAARFSHYAGCSPAFGNLFHHAIEMALKGYLSHFSTAEELKDTYRHNLSKLWRKVKTHLPDSGLEKFDQTIKELHPFHDIRYPDGFAKEMTVVVVVGAELVERTKDTSGQYHLHVQEIDELLVTIFEKSSVDPQQYTSRLPSVTRMYIAAGNPVVDALLKPAPSQLPSL